VFGGQEPEWTYTVGLWATYRLPELVVCGASFFFHDEVHAAVRSVVLDAIRERRAPVGRRRTAFGVTEFVQVDGSWHERLLLAVAPLRDVEAIQLIPVEFRTVDHLDLSRPFDEHPGGPWRWLGSDWDVPVDPDTAVYVDAAVLLGRSFVSQIAFSADGSRDLEALTPVDVPAVGLRQVAPAVLFGADATIVDALPILARGHQAVRDGPSAPWRAVG
jgi:Domain of unknown function (DUF4262)